MKKMKRVWVCCVLLFVAACDDTEMMSANASSLKMCLASIEKSSGQEINQFTKEESRSVAGLLGNGASFGCDYTGKVSAPWNAWYMIK